MINIRPMCEADLDAIMAVEVASFHTPWTRNDFEGELVNPLAYYLVAEDDGVIGYVGSWIIFDECHITNIAVSPEARKRGIGDALLKTLISDAEEKGVVATTLEVRPSNAPAIHLYEKYGFTVEGVRKRYYADTGEDALIMWRRKED